MLSANRWTLTVITAGIESNQIYLNCISGEEFAWVRGQATATGDDKFALSLRATMITALCYLGVNWYC